MPATGDSSRENTTGSSPRARKRPPPLPAATLTDDGDDDDAEDAEDWVPMQSRTQGRPYYYHTETHETTWDQPSDYEDDVSVVGATGWIELESKSQGRWYYFNNVTRECTWDRPEGVPEPPPFDRRPPNPQREALRDVIQDWSDGFVLRHGRDPTEEDLDPSDGSDIARHHRDYKMLKIEEDVEVLKTERAKLRRELDVDGRERLVEIKEQLTEMEPVLVEWAATKKAEHARRAEVTTVYNAWIKGFEEAHGHLPKESDIEEGSVIQGMHAEYLQYRKEAKVAKEREKRIETGKLRAESDGLRRAIRTYAREFKEEHDAAPCQADLPEGSEIKKLYAEYLDIERRINPDNPAIRAEMLRKSLADWAQKYEDVHARKSTRADHMRAPAQRAVTLEYESLVRTRERGEAPLAGVQLEMGNPPWEVPGTRSAKKSGRATQRDWEQYRADMSPTSPPYREYGSRLRGPARCGDCTVM